MTDDDKPKWSKLGDLLKDEAFRKMILDRSSLNIPFYVHKGRLASDFTAHRTFVGVDPAAANGDDAAVVYGTYKNGVAYVFDGADPYTTIDTTAQIVEDEPKQLPAPKEDGDAL